ncbi:hypothetical protein Dvina_01515 [Dactylosporangium vinaceum]|uniref:Uncharacterized protein n=1 Tax=Dactylosporangium vinaceum TaxID=53362 RepID=A0ABV5MMG0_9ACTN|nr:hypothetical protein [Dactylosporangium vinaceum]UAB96935.1 hypothetical protein Dvina_01515 [Dactylosporangium vinaceum]
MSTSKPGLSAVRADVARKRWSLDSRTREAIRVLVEQAPPLTVEQREQLRAVLARPAAKVGA